MHYLCKTSDFPLALILNTYVNTYVVCTLKQLQKWYTNLLKPVQTSLNLIFCYIKRVHRMNLLEGLCLELRNISFNYLRKLETHWNYLKRGKNWTQRGTDLWIDQVHDKMTFDWRLRLAKSCHIDLLLATTNCTVLQYSKLEIDY